uniref:Rho-GAP domain-containing protein n=1 Tax=Peronospora matthiolae TaxID=2874970 RepID=A0AAV1TJT6_9STRA
MTTTKSIELPPPASAVPHNYDPHDSIPVASRVHRKEISACKVPPLELQHDEAFQHTPLQQTPRSAMFGSCTQAASIVISVFFEVINRSGYRTDPTAQDSVITRQAKVLYVSLLESVQKERGEWQGFSFNTKAPEHLSVPSPREHLMSSLSPDAATADQCSVLNKLLEVSLRSLMGPFVPPELYAQHKKVLLCASLAVPPAFTTLLAIREILNCLERDVRHCLLRLFALWDLTARVRGSEVQPLMKTITDNQHYVFSKSFERGSMTARKSERQDPVATHLLLTMVLYRDVLFSDIEYIPTKQELQSHAKLLENSRNNAWASDTESKPTSLLEKDHDTFSSDGDISGSSDDDNNWRVCDRKRWWRQSAVSKHQLAFRSRTLSSGPFLVNDRESQGGETDESRRSLPMPSRYSSRRRLGRKTMRSRSMSSLPLSRGTDPLVSVKLSNSVDGILPPYILPRQLRLSKRIPTEYRKSLSRMPEAPVPNRTIRADSGTLSMSKKLSQRSSSLPHSRTSERCEKHEQDVDTISESSTASAIHRGKSARRKKSLLHHPSIRYSAADQAMHDGVYQFQEHEVPERRQKPRYLSVAASYMTTPAAAAATLCVLASIATIAIVGMRKAPNS